MFVPISIYISSSSIFLNTSKKYFGLKPTSIAFPSVVTNSSSFASPVWFVHDIVIFPTSTSTFTGYFFSFSILDDDIKLILSKQFDIMLLFTLILVSHFSGITFE